jgi:hypothetical protein
MDNCHVTAKNKNLKVKKHGPQSEKQSPQKVCKNSRGHSRTGPATSVFPPSSSKSADLSSRCAVQRWAMRTKERTCPGPETTVAEVGLTLCTARREKKERPMQMAGCSFTWRRAGAQVIRELQVLKPWGSSSIQQTSPLQAWLVLPGLLLNVTA